MKSSVLAIGTELTIGQIINRNASFISAQLKKLGALTATHLTVPDEKKLILQSLDFCASHSDFIFVTGGLGPTTDDFTREVISEWTGRPLHFDTSAWDHIVQRLAARNYPLQEMQKQQCYFPEGAQILTNSQGTAHGFFLETQGKKIWVLPGPPREIQGIWSDHIQAQLSEFLKDLDKNITFSWETLGLGESQIAALVEPLVENQGFEVGYRVHLPYVEVKFSFFESARSQATPILESLERTLAPWSLCRNDEDLWSLILPQIPANLKIRIHDAATGSFLLQRINAGDKNFFKRHFVFEIGESQKELRTKTAQNELSLSQNETSQLSMQLNLINEFEMLIKVAITAKDGQHLTVEKLTVEKTIVAPMQSPLMLERRQQYWTEMALVFLKQTLTSEHFLSIYKEI